MDLVCRHCSRTLLMSGERPVFCPYCGLRLDGSTLAPTEPEDESDGGPGGDGAASGGSGSGTGDTTVGYVGRLPSRRAAIPERIGGYHLIRALGTGGMGTVYEARDERSERRVAVKLINPEFVTSNDAVERFRQEGRLASTLEHPRCVFVLAADEHDGQPYIVMELMNGETLQGLVEANGPLPIGEAVTKILDVVEGLQAAHRRGVIHRDVKPSNCFLAPDGRVKVGDFGLAKSLADDANLTRTGAFIGTPSYASPEQIKGDPVDARTDVYSVAATLYYLVTGRPPFKEKDATATVARIVSEDPAPPRSMRPEVPSALDSVILKGLDRDEDRRWRDLESLRGALRPFAPGRLSIGGLGLRLGAFLIDLVLMILLYFAFFALIGFFASPSTAMRYYRSQGDWVGLYSNLVMVVYYTVAEGLFGCSIGKWLVELRVGPAAGGVRPGLVAALVRALGFYAIMGLPDDLLNLMYTAAAARPDLGGPVGTAQAFLAMGTRTVGVHALGVLILISTMKSRTGYRGPHEWLSGTRVVRATVGTRGHLRRRLESRREAASVLTTLPDDRAGAPERIGPYRVMGLVRSRPGVEVYQAEDETLARAVWVSVRSVDSPGPGMERQELSRASRPRWLTGGRMENGRRWDSYLATAGCPLAELSAPGGLSWAEARPILEDLVEELTAGLNDGTLPLGLNVDQVWVEPDGRTILVDALAEGPIGLATTETVFDLVAAAAVTALDGPGRLPKSGRPTSIRTPVPRHASAMFDRLLGTGSAGPDVAPFQGPDELLRELKADRDRPAEVSRSRRAAHLILEMALLAPGLIMWFWIAAIWNTPEMRSQPPSTRLASLAVAFGWPVVWTIWAAITRGGISLSLSGLALVRRDNRLTGRLRCGLRAFFVWSPIAILLLASMGLTPELTGPTVAGMTLWWIALTMLAIGPILVLFNPNRGPHDRMAGTSIVPR